MNHPTTELQVAPDRTDTEDGDKTGIYVRAKLPDGRWVPADIYQLDRLSLHRWLRSRGGKNLWAENCVLSLMGHEGFDEEPTHD